MLILSYGVIYTSPQGALKIISDQLNTARELCIYLKSLDEFSKVIIVLEIVLYSI